MNHSIIALVGLFIVGCSARTVDFTHRIACGDDEPAEPNGYCEDNSDCDPSDHCILERVLDSHLQTPTATSVPIERCYPRVGLDDWCDADDGCKAGLRCQFQPVGAYPATRGTCQPR